MRYTSLSNNDRGYNTQLDYSSIESWQDYCSRNKDVVWSRLFESKSGKLVRSYFREEMKYV